MNKYKKAATIIILFVVLFSFSGCSENKEEELKRKVISELEYLNIKIIDMLNELNNISFDNYTVISEKVSLDDETQTQEAQKEEGSSQEGGNGSSEENTREESQGGESGGGTTQGGNTGTSGQQGGAESEDLINTTKMVTDSMLTKDRNEIDWIKIKPEIEIINESWSVILLDLYSLNVKDQIILDFGVKLDSCIIAIKDEDKQQSLAALADMYASIPEFLKEIKADTNLQKIRQTQSSVINAYILAEDIGNIEIDNNITKAVDIYSEVMSDIDYTKDKSYKTNKVYVLLNELSNSIDAQDPELFYLKYKNFMKAVNEL